LWDDELFKLIKGDVVFVVDLEVGEDEFLFLRSTPQSEVPDALNELNFGLSVGVVGGFDVEDALWDEVGVGRRYLSTVLQFSLV